MKSYHYTAWNKRILEKLLCPTIFLALFFNTATQAEMLSVKGEGVNLRTGPGKQYDVKWIYGSGYPVELLERTGEWYKVVDFEDDTGWLHTSVLANTLHAIVKANRDNAEKINIRRGPGSDTKIVGKAHYGVVFKVVGRQSDWIKVQHESGLTGWVYWQLLWGL